MSKPTPICKTMCATCPFRDGSPYENLRAGLTLSAMSEASRICHSTATNALFGRTGKPARLCRGARDVQLRYLCAIGFLDEPTDAAWNAKAKEMGIVPNQICSGPQAGGSSLGRVSELVKSGNITLSDHRSRRPRLGKRAGAGAST